MNLVKNCCHFLDYESFRGILCIKQRAKIKLELNDLIILAKKVIHFEIVNLSGKPVTFFSVFTFVIILLLTFKMASLFQRFIAKVMLKSGFKNNGKVSTASRLGRYMVILIGVCIGLETIGINLSALFAAGAIFAVGIGFAMQNIAQNFVSGVILLMERTIQPGDVIELDGQFLKVKEIGIRITVANSLDEEELIIPNSSLVQSTVKNYTLDNSHYRVRTNIGVVYSSNLDVVRDTLERVTEAIRWKSPVKEPVILLKEFGDSAVVFEVSVWIDDPWRSPVFRSRLNQMIWDAFYVEKISMAFPQVDVHFDPRIETLLSGLLRNNQKSNELSRTGLPS